jgi:eukaryotic-like serine/threonine-protein kinase
MQTRLGTALEGRYTIDREIGAGGMATVYLARDVRHNRKVALEVLNPCSVPRDSSPRSR